MTQARSILSIVGLILATVFGADQLPQKYEPLIVSVSLLVGALINKKTSQSNPDGTPAWTAYVDPLDKMVEHLKKSDTEETLP